MTLNVERELASLQRMTLRDLKTRYAEVHGESTSSRHRIWLIKRILWRLQSMAEGDLSERARQRATELANEAEVRMSSPHVPKSASQQLDPALFGQVSGPSADRRLPSPGALITRLYKGTSVQVHVLTIGFEFEGTFYKSLSAVARKVTGQHCNGYLFFRLGKDSQDGQD